jgi:cytochrome c oxidase subunit 3/cytochrome o ubiquinol oxidase subunit 3
MNRTTAAMQFDDADRLSAEWKGRIGMLCFLASEASFFAVFVVTYLFYVGRSLGGPYPHDVLTLDLVVFNTACLLASSVTIALATRAQRRSRQRLFVAWWGITVLLGIEFLVGTAIEWRRLIVNEGLTISTNLFGTTFYSLVGFHAAHVTVGLVLLVVVLTLAFGRRIRATHAEKVELLSWYWHFVDGVWVVVFASVYVIGR